MMFAVPYTIVLVVKDIWLAYLWILARFQCLICAKLLIFTLHFQLRICLYAAKSMVWQRTKNSFDNDKTCKNENACKFFGNIPDNLERARFLFRMKLLLPIQRAFFFKNRLQKIFLHKKSIQKMRWVKVFARWHV